jgi:hypothetical protein
LLAIRLVPPDTSADPPFHGGKIPAEFSPESNSALTDEFAFAIQLFCLAGETEVSASVYRSRSLRNEAVRGV